MTGSETISIQEIADITQVSKRRLQIRLNRERWPYQTGANRSRLPYIDGLPEDVRMAVVSQRLAVVCQESGLVIRKPEKPPVLRNWQVTKALAWADLVRLYLEHVRKNGNYGSIMTVKNNFVRAYNAKTWPRLFEILGETSRQTLDRQAGQLKTCNDPIAAFAPRYGGKKGRRNMRRDQAEVLFSIVRSPYQPKKKSEIIRIARAVMHQKNIRDDLSDATYRRFLDEWIETHFDQWVFWREGEKGLHNKCLYWIERDYDKLEVGDMLVADGHTLNFETLNPWTGKPKRMTLIVWYDMKSNYPCGWEIMPTENIQAINAALRRAILMLGKIPKIAYLDNGKAFSSRFFNGVNLEEAGFSGVFERLGITPVYAWPYHPQSKPVERFFESFAELERIAPSYVGTSIAEKPPRLHMGEKTHRRMHETITGNRVPTLEETHRVVAAWFDVYAKREQQGGHLKGIRPADVFMEGRGPGVDPVELRELMMSMEIRTIRRRGIKFSGEWYYHPALYGRKHSVVIRYDLQDPSSILIYKGEEFICEAPRAGKVHPAADILGTDEDKAHLRAEIHMKKSLEKQTLSGARELLNTVVIPETTRQIESSGFDLSMKEPDAERPSKVKELPLTDEARARIRKEFDALEREHQEMERINWDKVAELPDMDRYEQLLEYEAQNIMIPKDEQAFMKYFEQTRQYAVNTDYYIEYRQKMTMIHQTN